MFPLFLAFSFFCIGQCTLTFSLSLSYWAAKLLCFVCLFTTKTTSLPSLTQPYSISLTPSLNPFQNAQCNARQSRASSWHALPYSQPWLGLLLGAARSLERHGRGNRNFTNPFDLGVKSDGDIAGYGSEFYVYFSTFFCASSFFV